MSTSRARTPPAVPWWWFAALVILAAAPGVWYFQAPRLLPSDHAAYVTDFLRYARHGNGGAELAARHLHAYRQALTAAAEQTLQAHSGIRLHAVEFDLDTLPFFDRDIVLAANDELWRFRLGQSLAFADEATPPPPVRSASEAVNADLLGLSHPYLTAELDRDLIAATRSVRRSFLIGLGAILTLGALLLVVGRCFASPAPSRLSPWSPSTLLTGVLVLSWTAQLIAFYWHRLTGTRIGLSMNLGASRALSTPALMVTVLLIVWVLTMAVALPRMVRELAAVGKPAAAGALVLTVLAVLLRLAVPADGAVYRRPVLYELVNAVYLEVPSAILSNSRDHYMYGFGTEVLHFFASLGLVMPEEFLWSFHAVLGGLSVGLFYLVLAELVRRGPMLIEWLPLPALLPRRKATRQALDTTLSSEQERPLLRWLPPLAAGLLAVHPLHMRVTASESHAAPILFFLWLGLWLAAIAARQRKPSWLLEAALLATVIYGTHLRFLTIILPLQCYGAYLLLTRWQLKRMLWPAAGMLTALAVSWEHILFVIFDSAVPNTLDVGESSMGPFKLIEYFFDVFRTEFLSPWIVVLGALGAVMFLVSRDRRLLMLSMLFIADLPLVIRSYIYADVFRYYCRALPIQLAAAAFAAIVIARLLTRDRRAPPLLFAAGATALFLLHSYPVPDEPQQMALKLIMVAGALCVVPLPLLGLQMLAWVSFVAHDATWSWWSLPLSTILCVALPWLVPSWLLRHVWVLLGPGLLFLSASLIGVREGEVALSEGFQLAMAVALGRGLIGLLSLLPRLDLPAVLSTWQPRTAQASVAATAFAMGVLFLLDVPSLCGSNIYDEDYRFTRQTLRSFRDPVLLYRPGNGVKSEQPWTYSIREHPVMFGASRPEPLMWVNLWNYSSGKAPIPRTPEAQAEGLINRTTPDIEPVETLRIERIPGRYRGGNEDFDSPFTSEYDSVTVGFWRILDGASRPTGDQ